MATSVEMATATIDIPCTPSRVLFALKDLQSYPGWCPFTPSALGSLTPGSPITLSVQFPGESLRTQTVIVQPSPPNQVIWTYTMLSTWILHAVRVQTVEEGVDPQSSTYTTHETMSGLLAPLVIALYGVKVKEGFEAVAHALKEECIKRYTSR